jgi:hypothetical protein
LAVEAVCREPVSSLTFPVFTLKTGKSSIFQGAGTALIGFNLLNCRNLPFDNTDAE